MTTERHPFFMCVRVGYVPCCCVASRRKPRNGTSSVINEPRRGNRVRRHPRTRQHHRGRLPFLLFHVTTFRVTPEPSIYPWKCAIVRHISLSRCAVERQSERRDQRRGEAALHRYQSQLETWNGLSAINQVGLARKRDSPSRTGVRFCICRSGSVGAAKAQVVSQRQSPRPRRQIHRWIPTCEQLWRRSKA